MVNRSLLNDLDIMEMTTDSLELPEVVPDLADLAMFLLRDRTVDDILIDVIAHEAEQMTYGNFIKCLSI